MDTQNDLPFLPATPSEPGGPVPTSCAVAAGSVERHLIDENWIMQSDDEALDDDCQSWWRLDSCPAGRWMIGKRYSPRVFVPIRRAGPRPDPLAHLTSPNAEISNAPRAQKKD